MVVLASLEPSSGPLQRTRHVRLLRLVLHAFVEGHDNICPQRILDVDGRFRSHHVFGTVDIGFEGNSFLCDFTEFTQGKNLEAAAVRENRAIPVHELVKSAGLSNDILAGSQIEMIGVSQNDFGAGGLHIFRFHGFHRSLSAHRHKYRGFNGAVGSGNPSPAGTSSGILMN